MLEYNNLLQEITRLAGDAILEKRLCFDSAEEKQRGEIVTPADLVANEIIVRELTAATPDIPIYSEEGTLRSENSTRWIVDPLDGTTPWVWGNSGFSVSIALLVDNVVAVGTVFDPIMQEFFFAEQGGGAFRNGEVISARKGVSLQDALLVVDWGNADDKRAEGVDYFNKFLVPNMRARRVVPQFAPALGLCRLAEGRIDGLVCNDTWVEDHAAAALIATEAGASVRNFDSSKPFDPLIPGIIASGDAALHAQIAEVVGP